MGKRGPKTDNPKKYRMAVKYDEECKNILEAYCKQENVNKMEAARRGIKKLKDDLARSKRKRLSLTKQNRFPTPAYA